MSQRQHDHHTRPCCACSFRDTGWLHMCVTEHLQALAEDAEAKLTFLVELQVPGQDCLLIMRLPPALHAPAADGACLARHCYYVPAEEPPPSSSDGGDAVYKDGR
jgi:hypothetical protein